MDGNTITVDENGVIGAEGINVPDASTAVAGKVQLNDSLNSTSTSQAATANAVKQLNDKIVGSGWIPITTLGYGFSIDTGQGDYLQVRKLANGIVQVRGTIRSTISGHALAIFDIPVNYRPKSTFSKSIVHDAQTSTVPTTTSKNTFLNFQSNGAVVLGYPQISLEGRKIWIDATFSEQ